MHITERKVIIRLDLVLTATVIVFGNQFWLQYWSIAALLLMCWSNKCNWENMKQNSPKYMYSLKMHLEPRKFHLNFISIVFSILISIMILPQSPVPYLKGRFSIKLCCSTICSFLDLSLLYIQSTNYTVTWVKGTGQNNYTRFFYRWGVQYIWFHKALAYTPACLLIG